jgi:hypothetical protein
MTRNQQEPGNRGEWAGPGVGFSQNGPGENRGIERQYYGLGALHGGCSAADDALPERGYTIHVASLRELSEMLLPEGHNRRPIV